MIGGPHAKSFPQDCLRYFDLVVLDCDQALIRNILSDEFTPGSIISSAKPYDEPPTIEERLPEIKASAFIGGRPHWAVHSPCWPASAARTVAIFVPTGMCAIAPCRLTG